MAAYQRKVRPEPKKPHLVTDEDRQRAFVKGSYPRNCLQCGTGYNYHPAAKDKGHEHKRGLFCSWDCKSQHIKDSKPGPFSRIYTAQCLTCNMPMVSRSSNSKYCGKACLPVAPKVEKPIRMKRCRLCDAEYEARSTGGMPMQYCSFECRDVVAASQRRILNSERKAKVRKATIEKVDPFVVFERDEWHCRMCGIPTPRDKRGSHDDNAPELDHIMPISKGGAHSYANTQCSCRQCNLRKSDNILHAWNNVANETFPQGRGLVKMQQSSNL
jgi:5-methylcytosine-specific restriction endonuclease McrA